MNVKETATSLARTMNDETFATVAIYPTYPVGEPWYTSGAHA